MRNNCLSLWMVTVMLLLGCSNARTLPQEKATASPTSFPVTIHDESAGELIDSISWSSVRWAAGEGCAGSLKLKKDRILARYRVNGDTVYLDRSHGIFWPVGSRFGCLVPVEYLNDSVREELALYYDLDSGASVDMKYRYEFDDIPGLFDVTIGSTPLRYVNQSFNAMAPTGFFYSGNEQHPPFNLFAYGPKVATLDSMEKMMREIEPELFE